MSNDRSNNFFPFLAGLAAGAVLGLLFAPRSGKETRDAIKDRARGTKEDVEDLVDEARDKWNATRNKATDAASGAKEDVGDILRFLFTEGRDLVDRLRRDTEHSQQ